MDHKQPDEKLSVLSEKILALSEKFTQASGLLCGLALSKDQDDRHKPLSRQNLKGNNPGIIVARHCLKAVEQGHIDEAQAYNLAFLMGYGEGIKSGVSEFLRSATKADGAVIFRITNRYPSNFLPLTEEALEAHKKIMGLVSGVFKTVENQKGEEELVQIQPPDPDFNKDHVIPGRKDGKMLGELEGKKLAIQAADAVGFPLPDDLRARVKEDERDVYQKLKLIVPPSQTSRDASMMPFIPPLPTTTLAPPSLAHFAVKPAQPPGILGKLAQLFGHR